MSVMNVGWVIECRQRGPGRARLVGGKRAAEGIEATEKGTQRQVAGM